MTDEIAYKVGITIRRIYEGLMEHFSHDSYTRLIFVFFKLGPISLKMIWKIIRTDVAIVTNKRNLIVVDSKFICKTIHRVA